MLTLLFITRMIIDCYALLLLLRAWLYATLDSPHYNPFYQLTIRWTQPLVKWSYHLLRPTAHFERPVIIVLLILLLLRAPLLQLLQPKHALTLALFHYLFIALITVVKLLGKLIFWVLTFQALNSWIPAANHLILQNTLEQLTAPLLRPIRQRLPTANGIDFSIMVATLLLITLNHLGYDICGPLWNNL